VYQKTTLIWEVCQKNNINTGSVQKNINMGSVPKNSINMGSDQKTTLIWECTEKQH